MHLDIEHFVKLDAIVATVVSAGGLYVTVAGGAVRDSVLEKPIADIDVFYQGELDKEVVKEHFGEPAEAKYNPPEPSAVDFNTWDLYVAAHDAWYAACEFKDEDGIPYDNTFQVDNYKGDCFNFDGMKVQLICVEDVDKHIASFPCHLSRMLYSEGMLVIPKEAIQDASLKIVRFTEECSEKYKEKIEKKYENYM